MPYNDDTPLLSEVIEVERVKSEDGKFSIKSATGDFYNFRRTKADGQQSKAHKTFSELEVQEGDTVGVAFKINESGGKVYRNIMLFKAYNPEDERPRRTNPAPRPAAPRPASRNGDAEVRARDTEARREQNRLEDEEKVIGMCATNFLSASLSAGLTVEAAHAKVVEYVQLAERLLAGCKAGSYARKRPAPPAQASVEDLSGPWDREDEPSAFDQDDNAF